MVSEKDLQSYLKVAASALPCREAAKSFLLMYITWRTI